MSARVKTLRLFDYFFFLRPTLFIPVWTIFLIGHYYSGEKFCWYSLLSMIIFTLMMGGVYILNQILDRESDRINNKVFFLAEDIIPLKTAYIYMFSLLIMTLAIAPFFGSPYFFVFLAALILGILYSLPPISLKARPFLDMFANGIGYGVFSFVLGWTTTGKPIGFMWIRSIPYFLTVSAVFVNTTIPDIPGDSATNKITTGVFMGKKNVMLLGLVLDLISLFIAVILKDWICTLGAAISLPFFILPLFRPGKKEILLSIRFSASILSLVMIFVYPVFGLLLLILYFSMKFYYKKRFNINYPAFTSGIENDF